MHKTQLLAKLGALTGFLDDRRIWYRNNHLLKYDTYFKMGGRVRVYISPQSADELQEVILYLKRAGLEYKVAGHTSNLLFLDPVEYSVVVSTRNVVGIRVEPDRVEAECGYPLQDLVRIAIMEGARGFEGLEGIPGSIGGAVVMNAGAYGYEISDQLLSVRCIAPDGSLQTLSKEQCGFNHRASLFKREEYLVVSAAFRLVRGDRKEIERKTEAFHIARHSYQEFVYPSLGSLFSMKGGFYRELLKKDPFYSALHLMLKLCFKNPVSKFVCRKRPNNAVFNKISIKCLGNLNFTPSPKSMNILINDGQCSLDDMVDYITRLRERLDQRIPLENEFVLGPLLSMAPEFEPLYGKIQAQSFLR